MNSKTTSKFANICLKLILGLIAAALVCLALTACSTTGGDMNYHKAGTAPGEETVDSIIKELIISCEQYGGFHIDNTEYLCANKAKVMNTYKVL